MAEVKNNFLASKMNKDVDARIVPPGEYRNALNLQINKSEGSNVGDLQTSLGNELDIDFKDLTNNENIQCIGSLVDEKSNTIIFFLTDYNQEGAVPTYNLHAQNYIYMYNNETGAINKLVEGAFLNFSITNPVIGVNLLEELLFWTDNRNQPRKINIVTAQQQPDYYTTEEQISVAKLNPYIPIEMYKPSASLGAIGEYETTMYDVVSEYLPFNGCSGLPKFAVTSDIIEFEPLQWKTSTPPSSDPKIIGSANVKVRPEPFQRVTLQDLTNPNGSIPIAGNPVVAEYPYLGNVNKVKLSIPITVTTASRLKFNANPYYDSTYIGDTNYLEDKFVKFSYRFKFDDGEYSIFAPFTQSAFIPKQDGYFGRKLNPEVSIINGTKRASGDQGAVGQSAGNVIKLMSNSIIPLPGQKIDSSTYVPADTYVLEWNDPYLTMSRDANAGVIPDYDAQFTFRTNPPNWIEDDQEATYKSTIVDFMQNKVNKILLRLRFPCNANELNSLYKITAIDILYKEANALAVSVVDTIPVEKIVGSIGNENIYEYVYDSKKPFKTLPEGQLIRVYDKVPIKALAQEVISNRVVYGNYQDKATYPQYLDYNVKYSAKSTFNASNLVNENRTSFIEYPNHSLKQNRTYQVGIILADIFGRQSGVILSNSIKGVTNEDVTYIAASLFVPYRTLQEANSGSDEGNALAFPGYSLKVLFNSIIPNDIPNPATGWPGLYNGDKESTDYNPLGWYSYKIVVKQVEQDYYNVYLPGALDGYPVEPFQRGGKTSHIVLLNDNINKVPRDLQEVGPVQLQFRSSVRLYGRVEPREIYETSGFDPSSISFNNNCQYFPANSFLFADTIATNESLFNVTATTPTYPFTAIYEVKSNPLIARLSTPATFGIGTMKAPTIFASTKNSSALTVLETQAQQSLLDIYWETSTTGLISELNDAILEGSSTAYAAEGFELVLYESTLENVPCSTRFAFKTILGGVINDIDVDTYLVTNLLGTPRSADFTLVKIPHGDTPPGGIPSGGVPGGILAYDTFYLETNNFFYYGFNSSIENSFRFRFSTNVGGLTNDVVTTGALINVAPTILNQEIYPDNIFYPTGTNINLFDGVNGSEEDGGKDRYDLQWSIPIATDQSTGLDARYLFSITNSPSNIGNSPNKRGLLSFVFGNPGGTFNYSLTIKLTDAGGLTDTYNIFVQNPT